MSHALTVDKVTADKVTVPAGHAWTKLPLIFLVLGVLGLLASGGLAVSGGKQSLHQFYFSYLIAFLYWLSLALGAIIVVMIQHAARAGWSVVIRRLAESLAAPLWIFGLFVLPILFVAYHDLYHWTHHDVVASDKVLQHKSTYLNPLFFQIRGLFYVVVWGGLGIWFWRKSTMQDRTGHKELTRRMQAVSCGGLLLVAYTMTFAAFDWIMSLEPHWFSTMFGVYYFAGAFVSVFALLIVLGHAAKKANLTAGAITVEHFHDMGKFLFAFTVFWAYIAFSQYLLIWYANLPEETIWYAQRWAGGWLGATLVLAGGHFAFPFFFLMSRHIKRRTFTIVFGALYMLVLHYIDLFWLVMPTHHKHLAFSPLDLTTWIGIGGVYLFLVSRLWQKAPMIPVGDPRLHESLAFENF